VTSTRFPAAPDETLGRQGPTPNALVLVHEGLDVSADLELGTAEGDRGAVRHRGGDRLLVTARADRAALEWALALTGHVVALTVGPPGSGSVLAWATGRGASRAVRIWDDALDGLDLAAMARVVAAAVRRLAPELVVAGERGLAGATGALPALVAAHLGWPCVDGAIRVSPEGDGVVVERRLRGGWREELDVLRPAIVTVTADSVEPRYVSVRARRDASRRGHETWSLADLGLTPETVRGAVRLRVSRVDWPRPRPRRTAAAAPAGPPRSAADRLRQLVGGGAAGAARRAPAASAPASTLVEGDPRAAADRILAFLEQHGFV
jgi:electron transfer flavoprotein beta subunit